jgi:polyisoprenoid-binding protein YceI
MRAWIVFLALFCFFAPPTAAEYWNLPHDLNPENTRVTFEVDSTWHTVHGVAKQVEGRLWLDDTKNFRSIRGRIKFPVAAFDTENADRDEKLREVMHSDSAPEVIFEFREAVPGLCDPSSLVGAAICRVEIPGILTINDVSRKVVLRAEISALGRAYKISGTTVIKWADYRVDDPSIFIAKLYEEVKIDFLINLEVKS